MSVTLYEDRFFAVLSHCTKNNVMFNLENSISVYTYILMINFPQEIPELV